MIHDNRRWLALCVLSLLGFGACPVVRDEDVADLIRRDDEVVKQYREADYQTAKSALLDYIRYLDQRPSGPRVDMVRIHAMVACVRLAKLEDKNHGSQTDDYMKQAVARCQPIKAVMFPCTEELLRSQVDQMDALVDQQNKKSGA